jgi:hypothetical protein
MGRDDVCPDHDTCANLDTSAFRYSAGNLRYLELEI